jgi:hypothetical protein
MEEAGAKKNIGLQAAISRLLLSLILPTPNDLLF